MLQKHKNGTNIGIGIGILLQVAATYAGTPLDALLLVAGWVAFIWGCSEYARGKGHSAWFGALGLLSIFGLIVLVLMPDRHKEVMSGA